MVQKAKKPKKTAQEVAQETRQRTLLDKEIEEQEERFAFLARGKLGRSSLLSGAPKTQPELAGRSPRGGAGGGGSLLPGGGTPSAGSPRGVRAGSRRAPVSRSRV